MLGRLQLNNLFYPWFDHDSTRMMSWCYIYIVWFRLVVGNLLLSPGVTCYWALLSCTYLTKCTYNPPLGQFTHNFGLFGIHSLVSWLYCLKGLLHANLCLRHDNYLALVPSPKSTNKQRLIFKKETFIDDKKVLDSYLIVYTYNVDYIPGIILLLIFVFYAYFLVGE